jgi:hypothetical protein
LSGQKGQLPALDERVVQKLMKLSAIKEMETNAAQFLIEMFKINKVQREGLVLVADYFIENKAFICNEYLVNVLEIVKRKDDFIYTYFTCIQTQNEPYFWLSKLNDILKFSTDLMVQSSLIDTINVFAEKGIDILIMTEIFLKRLNNPEELLKDNIRRVLQNYQKHYNHFNLNAL